MRKPSYLNVVLTGLMVAMIVLVGNVVGPALEGRLLPVYSRFEPAIIEPVPEGAVAQFSYVKRRDCQPMSFSWFVGEFGASSRQVSVQPLHPTRTRPLGEHLTTPYLFTGVTPDQVRNGMHAEVISRCHPFWLTRTEIYP